MIRALAVCLLAALSLATAATHFSVIGEHWHEHLAYGLFFMALAWFQVLWAIAMLVRPRRRLALAGVLVDVGAIVVFVVSRTSGLPLGPEAWEPETAAALGITCTAVELAVVLLAGAFAIWPGSEPVEVRSIRSSRTARAAVAAVVLAVAVGASASLASVGGEGMDMSGYVEQTGALPADSSATSVAPSGMAGMPGMGAPGPGDAGSTQAAADPVDPSWHYTGPALAQGTTRLLTTVYDETEEGHAMQDPPCTQAPTPAQQQAALTLVQRTTAAVAKYHDLQAAVADGYVPITSTTYPMVHYLKGSYLSSEHVLDPNHVQSLVYDRLPSGQEVLVAAMYLMPSPGDSGPTPGGCLTKWHAHTNLCMSLTLHRYVGFSPCPAGTLLEQTPEMLHVWQVPVPGGPLAMDPTDLQVMQAAIMATEGTSPS